MGIPTGFRPTELCPDLASMLRSWYKDTVWQNVHLFPWTDEETLLLSEVYTENKIVEYKGRGRKRVAISLNNYKELFKDMTPEGNRILVEGDPGIGKTTFTHKIAYDWATGNLPQFDLVLVLKLKFSSKDQTIENMVAEQLHSISDTPNPAFSDSAASNYLKSGKDRVLLVLDGLAEIKLKEFQHVQEILRGEAYRKCCILATTRPHVAWSLHNKMTKVAEIKGFSRELAKQFVSHIIPEESQRKRFFQQILKNQMSKLFLIPMLLLIISVLETQLSDSDVRVYHALVLYLKKRCQEKNGLTEEEFHEAMDEINELAFRGLTREDRQLVFSRDEIKNENIMKLGLLAAEKSGSGFRPTTVLSFVNKTLQEYCAADHVAKQYVKGKNRPWKTVKGWFNKDLISEPNRDD